MKPNYKKSEKTTTTRDFLALEKETDNIYKSLVIASKRANCLSEEIKTEIDLRTEDFKTTNDNLDEVFENTEQIEMSKSFEKLPKPTLVALNELTDGELTYLEEKEKEDN